MERNGINNVIGKALLSAIRLERRKGCLPEERLTEDRQPCE